MHEGLATATAKLTIVSKTLSPNEISRQVGLQCDDSRKKRDPKGASVRVWEENIWWLYETSNSREPEASVEQILTDCIERLSSRLRPALGNIRALSTANCVELGLYMLAQTVPAIHLDTSTIDLICKMGAELDVDVVLYGND